MPTLVLTALQPTTVALMPLRSSSTSKMMNLPLPSNVEEICPTWQNLMTWILTNQRLQLSTWHYASFTNSLTIFPVVPSQENSHIYDAAWTTRVWLKVTLNAGPSTMCIHLYLTSSKPTMTSYKVSSKLSINFHSK